jgi:beta-lactamase superfamily II metal-dependent hydrolase
MDLFQDLELFISKNYCKKCFNNKKHDFKKICSSLYPFNAGKMSYIHHEICHVLFENAMEYKQEIWIHLDFENNLFSIDNIENNDRLRLSILTNAILEYDQLFFEHFNDDIPIENNIALNMYRPYFFNFIFDFKELKKLRSKIENTDASSGWYCAEVIEHPAESDLIGDFELSASPIIYKSNALRISGNPVSAETLEKIKSVYQLNSSTSTAAHVNYEINHIFSNTTFTSAHMYNVGDGNFIYLYGNSNGSEKRLLFDVGYSYRQKPRQNVSTYKYAQSAIAIRQMQPHMVILSHWDCDHFLGAAFCGRKMFDCKWIAPDFRNISSTSVSAWRLAIFLNQRKKLELVSNYNSKIASVVVSKNIFNLYEGKGTGYLSKSNESGLIIEISNNHMNSLFCGDVSYEALPQSLDFSSKDYDNLVVPHHGSNMDTGYLHRVNNKRSYICASGNIIERPSASHQNALKNAGYTITLSGSNPLSTIINLV